MVKNVFKLKSYIGDPVEDAECPIFVEIESRVIEEGRNPVSEKFISFYDDSMNEGEPLLLKLDDFLELVERIKNEK